MLGLYADWEMVGWAYASDEEGTNGEAWAEGCVAACVGREVGDD